MFVSRILVLFSAIAIASASPAYAGSEAKGAVGDILTGLQVLKTQVGTLDTSCKALDNASTLNQIANIGVLGAGVATQVKKCLDAVNGTPTISATDCTAIYNALHDLGVPIGSVLVTLGGKVLIIQKLPNGNVIVLAQLNGFDTNCSNFIDALKVKCPNVGGSLTTDETNLHNAFTTCKAKYM